MTPLPLLVRLRTLRLDDYSKFAWQCRLQLLAAAAAVLTFVVAPAPAALPGLALASYKAALYVGCAIIVFKGVTQFLTAMSDGVRSQQVRAVFTIVERSVWLYVSLGLIRIFGQALSYGLEWIRLNPDEALAGAAGCLVVHFMFLLWSKSVWHYEMRGVSAYGVALHRKPIGPDDIHRTSVHEAGHLLLYAALATLPDDLAVSIATSLGPSDRSRGFVQSGLSSPDVFKERYLLWLMLVKLAGNEAEYIALGDRTDGAADDNAQWLQFATAYLASGFGDVFFMDEQSSTQIAHNRSVLNDLKADHVALLRSFLQHNRALLDELAGAIVKSKFMARDQLAPYLARVDFSGSPMIPVFAPDHCLSEFEKAPRYA